MMMRLPKIFSMVWTSVARCTTGRACRPLHELLRLAGQIDLEIGDGFRRFLLHNLDTQDVALLVRDDAGQLVQHAGAGIGAHFYSDSLGHS